MSSSKLQEGQLPTNGGSVTVGSGGAGQEQPARVMLVWWGELCGHLQLDEGAVTSHAELIWENASVPPEESWQRSSPQHILCRGPGSRW